MTVRTPYRVLVALAALSMMGAAQDDEVVNRALNLFNQANYLRSEGRLDEAQFLYDSDRAMDDREKVILKRLEHDDWDLFVAAIETTDRI